MAKFSHKLFNRSTVLSRKVIALHQKYLCVNGYLLIELNCLLVGWLAVPEVKTEMEKSDWNELINEIISEMALLINGNKMMHACEEKEKNSKL